MNTETREIRVPTGLDRTHTLILNGDGLRLPGACAGLLSGDRPAYLITIGCPGVKEGVCQSYGACDVCAAGDYRFTDAEWDAVVFSVHGENHIWLETEMPARALNTCLLQCLLLYVDSSDAVHAALDRAVRPMLPCRYPITWCFDPNDNSLDIWLITDTTRTTTGTVEEIA